MEKYDIIIIGGGVSGLSCAITLGSAASKLDAASDKRILVIDAGASHLNKAEINNVAGIAEGTKGPELLGFMAKQAKSYKNVRLLSETVLSVSGTKGNFTITTDSEDRFQADTVVFANGMQTIDVEGINDLVVDHIRAPRPGMVMIKNDYGKIGDGKYVTGCAAGASSMFAAAAGYGAQTATDIISTWTGKYTVIHDVLKKD
ncbi:MAG: FAD-dependent oxidoreductase [Sulfurovum sp.]|nr:FAD-dependent oxidoreductase [Sulfurovum sp.]